MIVNCLIFYVLMRYPGNRFLFWLPEMQKLYAHHDFYACNLKVSENLQLSKFDKT